ncbi:MAG: OsmC family protein [Planctomycetaceae bacterium]|nr:OsmC family protein [Planctomycetaceae bacterium]
MIKIEAKVQWNRDGAVFTDNRYSRGHQWSFDGGQNIRASSSPHVVPIPLSDAAAVDPEEAFVASISSCHMLWFLSFAAKEKWVVDQYVDQPIGTMEKNEEGKMVVAKVQLNPKINWSGERVPEVSDVARLHELSHEHCFIANSVRTKITIAH